VDLGVAAAQLPTEKLSGDALASAITAGLADAGLASRATELEKMLANDNGVHNSVPGRPARAGRGAPRVRAGAHGSGAARRWI